MPDSQAEERSVIGEVAASRGEWPLRVALGCLATLVIGPAAAHFGIAPPIAGFALFVAAGVIGFVNSFAALAALARLRGGARGRALAAIALCDIPALVVIVAAVPGFGKPLINDVATDLTEPPTLVYAQSQPGNSGRDMVYPEAFKAIVRSAYPDLKPLRLAEPPDRAFANALRVAEQRPEWQVLYVNGTSRVFEGVATSPLFRFQDDFIVRVRADGDGSIVDLRSKSRDGKGDLGANAERIRAYLGDLARSK